MFEQYISDWLTSYLGHFLDIKSENLRANILSGKIVAQAGSSTYSTVIKRSALTQLFLSLPD